MGSLQLNRGSLANKPILKEGEVFLDETNRNIIAMIGGAERTFLPSENIIEIERNIDGVISKTHLDLLTEVYANTQSGDLVIVHPGTYDLGNENIQLKDGVNWRFLGNPTISSDSADGTFSDNAIAVDVKFDGTATIVNTSNSTKRFVLSNAASDIDRYIKPRRWVAELGYSNGAITIENLLHSDFPNLLINLADSQDSEPDIVHFDISDDLLSSFDKGSLSIKANNTDNASAAVPANVEDGAFKGGFVYQSVDTWPGSMRVEIIYYGE